MMQGWKKPWKGLIRSFKNMSGLLEIEQLKDEKEKALLVFIKLKFPRETKKNVYKETNDTVNNGHGPEFKINEEIEELKNLASAAGAEVKEVVFHKQSNLNPKYLISTGKLEEIRIIVEEGAFDLAIFDNELTPAQQSNLENKLKIKVIDRTALILDIFAQRAQSSEGKLQVELAQLNYLLPRLIGKGVQLSRLGGGIGTRGPGEQKLEVDRRTIRKRITQLEERINQIAVQRDIQRKTRQDNNIFSISLVGYTNGGKSTLLNMLTRSEVLVKDMLFSTLDSTTRKLKIPESDEILISDTVGFIEKLPHQLVAAFKSTLEEVRRADLLLMVIDAANINFEQHIRSVMNVLKELEVQHKTIILVFNKTDKLDDKSLGILKLKYRNALFISALKKVGLGDLYEKIKKTVDKNRLSMFLKIPYSETKVISFIFNNCKILDKKYEDDGVVLKINANSRFEEKLTGFAYKEFSSEED
jgi:GTP-binding protein HflX